MIIVDTDYRIELEDRCFTLYVLKNKKEIKEGDNLFKVEGYYTQFKCVLKAIVRYRLGKKYPGKESVNSIKEDIDNYNKYEKFLTSVVNIQSPIIKLKNRILWNC